MAKRPQSQGKLKVYSLLSPEERLAVWEKARGMWKHRWPDPIREIKKIRGAWRKKAEDYLLERSPKFWAMIRRARRGKSVALDEVRRQLGLSKK